MKGCRFLDNRCWAQRADNREGPTRTPTSKQYGVAKRTKYFKICTMKKEFTFSHWHSVMPQQAIQKGDGARA